MSSVRGPARTPRYAGRMAGTANRDDEVVRRPSTRDSPADVCSADWQTARKRGRHCPTRSSAFNRSRPIGAVLLGRQNDCFATLSVGVAGRGSEYCKGVDHLSQRATLDQ